MAPFGDNGPIGSVIHAIQSVTGRTPFAQLITVLNAQIPIVDDTLADLIGGSRLAGIVSALDFINSWNSGLNGTVRIPLSTDPKDSTIPLQSGVDLDSLATSSDYLKNTLAGKHRIAKSTSQFGRSVDRSVQLCFRFRFSYR